MVKKTLLGSSLFTIHSIYYNVDIFGDSSLPSAGPLSKLLLGSCRGGILGWVALGPYTGKRQINKRKTKTSLLTYVSYVHMEHPVLSSPKGWLELGLTYHLRLNKGKRVWGSWARKASYGKVIRKSMVNKCCLVRLVMQI